MDEETSSRNAEIWVTKFDEEHAKKFREAVVSNSRMDPSRPIVIYIDSYGGMVDSLASMIETLDEIPNPIVTVCIGKAMSCGAILLSHGDVRFCGRHSRIMVHEVSSGTFGDVHDMHADVQETKRLNEYFMGLLAKNCGIDSYTKLRKLIKEQDGRDRYMNAEDAMKFGIVDAVGTPKITSTLMYEVNVLPPKPDFESRNKSRTNKKTVSKTKRVKKSDSKK